MKAKFIQENVILSEHKGPFGLDSYDDWAGMTVMQIYELQYPNTKIITFTDVAKILKVGDWGQYYYIIAKAKNAS